MNKNQLGTSDLPVPAICLGTMTFGQQNSEADAHAQLDYAQDQGVNFIDAAEMYPVPVRAETAGLTERYMDTWLKHQARPDHPGDQGNRPRANDGRDQERTPQFPVSTCSRRWTGRCSGFRRATSTCTNCTGRIAMCSS